MTSHPFLPGPLDVERCFTCGEKHEEKQMSDEIDSAECNHGHIGGCVLDDGQSAWQPIETAPKDGTRVLVWFVDLGEGRIEIASYVRHAYEEWYYVDTHTRKRRDCVNEYWKDSADVTCGEALLWMPLPEPPKGAR